MPEGEDRTGAPTPQRPDVDSEEVEQTSHGRRTAAVRTADAVEEITYLGRTISRERPGVGVRRGRGNPCRERRVTSGRTRATRPIQRSFAQGRRQLGSTGHTPVFGSLPGSGENSRTFVGGDLPRACLGTLRRGGLHPGVRRPPAGETRPVAASQVPGGVNQGPGTKPGAMRRHSLWLRGAAHRPSVENM
jgi:hypothetical protein